MEEVDIRAPLYYILGRDIAQGDLVAAHFVFTITPCSTAAVCRHSDRDLVAPFVFQTLKAQDEVACRDLVARLARVTGCPMLTVGEGQDMTAVYHDGSEETICLSKLSL